MFTAWILGLGLQSGPSNHTRQMLKYTNSTRPTVFRGAGTLSYKELTVLSFLVQ